LVIIASKKPLKIDYGLWLERLQDEKVRSYLREVHLDHPHAMLSHFMLDAQSTREYFGDVPLNSDNRPYVEFGREIGVQHRATIFNDLMSYRTSILPLLTNLPADRDSRLKLYDDLARYYYAMKYAIPGRYFLSVTYDRSKAEPLIEKAMMAWPDNEAFAHMLGKCSHVIESDRAQPFHKWWAKGWLNERAGKWPAAIAAYRQAVAENPTFPKAFKSLAFACERSGRYSEAIQAMRQLLELEDKPEYPRFYLALLIRRALDRRDEELISVSFEGKEMQFNRKDLKTYLFLAKAYNEVGLPGRAEEILGLAAELNPKSGKVYEVMGYNSLDLGHFRDAERHFKQALKLDPKLKHAAAQLYILNQYIGKLIHPEHIQSDTVN
jgi:tetratricopeptide (TPR) repeat protein